MNKEEKSLAIETKMLRFTLNNLIQCVDITLNEINIAHEQLRQLEKSIKRYSKKISY